MTDMQPEPEEEFLDTGFQNDDEDDVVGDEIDLNFGGVDSITGFVPVPSGAYALTISRAKIVQTKDKTGHNVQVTIKVIEGEHAGQSIGIDIWYVPNKKVQTPKKYETTAGFFKGRLEAVYDAPVPDDFRLNVQDLLDKKFKGIVVLQDEGYGPQSKVTTYLPYSADLSNVVIPAPSARTQQRTNGGGSPTQTPSGGGQPGTFRI